MRENAIRNCWRRCDEEEKFVRARDWVYGLHLETYPKGFQLNRGPAFLQSSSWRVGMAAERRDRNQGTRDVDGTGGGEGSRRECDYKRGRPRMQPIGRHRASEGEGRGERRRWKG